MAQLEALLSARPPQPARPEKAGASLRRLLLELAEQASGPMERRLEGHGFAEARTFEDYVVEAEALAADPQLGVDELLVILGDAGAITSDSAEYVLDLLRRVGESRAVRDGEDTRFLDAATDAHLRVLHAMSDHHLQLGIRHEDEAWMRRSLRAARRALEIVRASPARLDPDVHADLLLDEGRTLWKLDPGNVKETIASYREALRLKREAGNEADVHRLIELFWTQIDYRVGRALASLAPEFRTT